MVDEEPRAAVIAHLDSPIGPLIVANTHLSFVPGWGRLQLRRIRRDLATLPDPAILMGDLNMEAARPVRVTGYRSLAEHPTFPLDEPDRQLDHVLARGAVGQVVDSRAVRLPLSDHLALVVDLAEAGAAPDGRDGIGRPAPRTLPLDQLEERAVAAVSLLDLVEQGQLLVLEHVEPLLPGDVLQLVGTRASGEVEPEHAGAAASGVPDDRRAAVVLAHPALDLVVVGGLFRRRRHGSPIPPDRDRHTARPGRPGLPSGFDPWQRANPPA